MRIRLFTPPGPLTYDMLNQRQLTLLKFRRHKLAVAAAFLLAGLYIMALFSPFFAPYGKYERNLDYIYCPPQKLGFDRETGLHAKGLRRMVDPVTLNSYYEDAVTWAADNGIVNGTGATTFSPNTNVTREQMAAMMRRYASFKKLDTSAKADLSTFTDASAVSAWATGDLQWAVASELLYGNNHNELQPTANATRAQAAAILQRFATKIVK